MPKRGRAVRVLLIAIFALPLLATLIPGADAQDEPIQVDPQAGVASVLQVSGLLDPILADFVSDRIIDAKLRGFGS